MFSSLRVWYFSCIKVVTIITSFKELLSTVLIIIILQLFNKLQVVVQIATHVLYNHNFIPTYFPFWPSKHSANYQLLCTDTLHNTDSICSCYQHQEISSKKPQPTFSIQARWHLISNITRAVSFLLILGLLAGIEGTMQSSPPSPEPLMPFTCAITERSSSTSVVSAKTTIHRDVSILLRLAAVVFHG